MDSYTPSTEQLSRLSELEILVRNLKQKGIDYTIIGGYGLDGLYGKLTRDHGDIDIVVNNMDETSVILKEMGYVEFFGDSEKAKRVFKKESLGSDWNIDFISFENLLDRTGLDIKPIIPDKDNASLDNFTFKTQDIEGQKAVIEALTKYASDRNWESYRYKDHREKIMNLLEERQK